MSVIEIALDSFRKPVVERLMENLHAAGFAAGRYPEESPPNGGICERRTGKYAAVPPARRAYAPEGRGMRVTQPFDFAQGHELVEWQMGVFRQPLYYEVFAGSSL